MFEYKEGQNVQLFRGDCLEVMPMLPQLVGKVDMVLTDPAYRVISGGTNSPLASGYVSSVLEKNDGKIFKHNDTSSDQYIPQMLTCCKNNCDIYIMTNNLNLRKMLNVAEENKIGFHNLLAWRKNNKNANRWYMKELEYTLYFWTGQARKINNAGSSQLFEAKNPVNKSHPTEKPVELMEHYILNSTNEGDLILDFMMGSGTTGVACQNTNRRFIGIELDAEYFDVACKRMGVDDVQS